MAASLSSLYIFVLAARQLEALPILASRGARVEPISKYSRKAESSTYSCSKDRVNLQFSIEIRYNVQNAKYVI
jgi:hypothetical protein